VKPIPHSDKIRLDAAEGWLGLGDLVSANEELEQITPENLSHPAVLLMRCEIYQAAKKWENVISIANMLVEQLPKLSDAWIKRSYALHELKRTQEAYDLLLPAAKLFSKLWVIRYNLACYACVMGKIKIAMERLKQAIELAGTKNDIRKMALNDPDLEKIWTLVPAI